MDEEHRLASLDDEAEKLEQRGIPPGVALSYIEIGPLLAENIAISEYIMEKGDLDLRRIFPEIVSLTEALLIAEMDRPMSDKDRLTLATLLRPLVPI